MKYDVVIGKKTHNVIITKSGEFFYEIRVDGTLFEVDARKTQNNLWTMLIGHHVHDVDVLSANGTMTIAIDGDTYETEVIDELRKTLRERKGKFEPEGAQEVKAPMPGKVVKILVQPGTIVNEGEGLIIVEAMKMENLLKSLIKGVVKEVFVKEGQAVEARMKLITVDPIAE